MAAGSVDIRCCLRSKLPCLLKEMQHYPGAGNSQGAGDGSDSEATAPRHGSAARGRGWEMVKRGCGWEGVKIQVSSLGNPNRMAGRWQLGVGKYESRTVHSRTR